jgi:hypothetical protein
LFLVPLDRLLAAIGVVAGGQRLVPLLVGAWPVSGLTGEVLRVAVSLWLPRPPLLRLPLLGVAAPVLATPLATAHLPHTPSLLKRTAHLLMCRVQIAGNG